jgi:hypothetical protein
VGFALAINWIGGVARAVEIQERFEGKVVEVSLSGKLTKEAYLRFAPLLENAIRGHGKIRVLVDMHDFHGWDAGALWEDIKFDWRHFRDIERLALVGERKWEAGMAVLCKPFTTATVKYFDRTKLEEARQWVAAGLPAEVNA